MARIYYSVRTGRQKNNGYLSLEQFERLFFSTFNSFCDRNYFREALGFECTDRGRENGTLGSDIGAKVLLGLKKDYLWPLDPNRQQYSEDDIFDLMEFFYDHVSKPVDGYYHDWNACGWHYNSFDVNAGRGEFRSEMNDVLKAYGAFELNEVGHIVTISTGGLASLERAPLPKTDPANVEERVELAIDKFRRHNSSYDDRRDAIRNLADVLEYLRPKLEKVLDRKDEADLFQIANRFGIRHHDGDQKTNYDKAIWYSWIFYFYLATIHAALRLVRKEAKKK